MAKIEILKNLGISPDILLSVDEAMMIAANLKLSKNMSVTDKLNIVSF
jgi:hypothetical protein